MASYRLIFGIIIGIVLSFLSVFFFNMESISNQIQTEPSLLRAIALLIGANFNYDIIAFFTGTPSVTGFFAAQLLAWLFIGYVSGTIAKGLKRGITASLLVVVIDILIWIILNIIVGIDMMAFFQGNQLSETLGGLISAFIGVFIGGSVGGLISGPNEEYY
ncbi:hypothetical protein LCGC14_1273630 [marine sediment metagenome]|uniref:Uncharacterized protein n=1 Tax=marine sediment metagenome TaxID=412755 RepID=A0A0F9NE19_9ZZZZ|nr:MAG: hypothetical protein Lokiarch_51730 [Candidatus Lokiarchaeum sp. GC14_75]